MGDVLWWRHSHCSFWRTRAVRMMQFSDRSLHRLPRLCIRQQLIVVGSPSLRFQNAYYNYRYQCTYLTWRPALICGEQTVLTLITKRPRMSNTISYLSTVHCNSKYVHVITIHLTTAKKSLLSNMKCVFPKTGYMYSVWEQNINRSTFQRSNFVVRWLRTSMYLTTCILEIDIIQYWVVTVKLINVHIFGGKMTYQMRIWVNHCNYFIQNTCMFEWYVHNIIV